MGTVPIINANDIVGITGLGHKPIYFITLQGQTQATLVVKGENMLTVNNNDARVSMTWAAKLMKNVNSNQVNVKLMTPTEITEFLRAGNATFAANSNEAYHLGINYNWVKMPKVNNLEDLTITTPVGGFTRDDAKLIKRTVLKLMDQNAWYELGKVVAVDIFNGNNDRFKASTGEWANHGNIMFTNGHIIGMDAWDPSGSNGVTTESNLVQGGGFKELNILTDLYALHEFATKATANVGSQLSKALQRTGTYTITVKTTDNSLLTISTDDLTTLFNDQVTEFKRGIWDGANQLKTYLQQKRTQHSAGVLPSQTTRRANFQMGGNRNQAVQPTQGFTTKAVPKGILDRMNYLKW